MPVWGFAFRYVSHLLRSVDEHGIHAPFLYKLLTEAVYNKSVCIDFHSIEDIRKKCLENHTRIEVLDLGAGSRLDGKNKSRSIRFICKSFAKNPRICRVLHNTVKHLQPKTTLELGTSLGISTMYLASGFKDGTVYTIEGCPQTSKLAQQHFNDANIGNVVSINGGFDDVLPDLMRRTGKIDCVYIDGNHTFDATLRYFEMLTPFMHEGSCIIFDDIHWSAGMAKAWEHIVTSSQVTLSVDFFHLGMVFFNSGLSKEHFRVRL